MYNYRLRKESNECQTDIQCTPFILSENETANVHSSRLCQTEIQLSPRAPDTELYAIIPYIDEDDIEKNAIRSVNIKRNRKIKLQFFLPISQSDTATDNNDYKYIITDGLNEEVTYLTENENLERFSNESFYKVETRKPVLEHTDSTSSIGTLKSAIKKILKEDESIQTDLMIAPHILNDTEKAIITINTSCQTSVTCSPRTSLTDVVPMLKNYCEHQGEIREAFNKTENVLEILKEVIQDVINIHQHMFDPNYNLPSMNPVLVKIDRKDSSINSSEWDTISPSKTTKQTVRDVSGDGSFDNTISEVDYDLKQSTVPSISTISEVTTLHSSDFTLTSKDDDDDDGDDDVDSINDILDRLKERYTVLNEEQSEKLSVKLTKSEPTVSRKMEPVMAIKPYLEEESNTESFGSELWSESDSKSYSPKETSNKCDMLNGSCVCSGIKIKLYLKDKSDNDNENPDHIIEMKIKPDLENVEIKKVLNISTNPDLAKICTAIPFQEIENCLKDKTAHTDSSEENITKLLEIKDQPEATDVDVSKADGFQIMINMQKNTAFSPQTASEEFLQSFMLTNLLLKDIENAPYPKMLNKVSFPNRTYLSENKDNTEQLCSCSCSYAQDQEKSAQLPKNKDTIPETVSPFTAVFGRLYEDPDILIPFDSDELFCVCKHDDNESILCDVEYEMFPVNNHVEVEGGNPPNKEFQLENDRNFDRNLPLSFKTLSADNKELRNMSSDVILPKKAEIVRQNQIAVSNSVTYDGRIYKTDKFILPGGSYGSEESEASNDSVDSKLHGNTVNNKIRQIHAKHYEEQMYTAHAGIMHQNSNIFVTDEDCICGQKLEETYKECPHCFRRIGPQYGRDQRGLNDDYELNEPKEQPDYCSIKQNPAQKFEKGFFISSVNNYTFFPTALSSTNMKEISMESSNSHVAKIVENSQSKYKRQCNSLTSLKKDMDDSYILIDKKVSERIVKDSEGNKPTSNPSKQVEIIEKVYPTGKIVIGKMNPDYSDETKLKNTESCNICYGDEPCPKILCQVEDIVKHPLNYECSKSAVEKTSVLDKNITDKKEKCKTSPKTKCQTCSKAKFNQRPNKNLKMIPLQSTSLSKKETYKATSKTKCQICSQAKPNKTPNRNLAIVPIQDTSSLNTILANNKEKYEATSKIKCQTCSQAKLNQINKKNLSIVTIQGICSICSSTDEIVEIMQNNAKNDESYTSTEICNKDSGKPGIKLEAKKSEENLQNLIQKEEIIKTQQNIVTKKCLSCSNLSNKESYISSNLKIQQDKYPKAKGITCKKSLNFANTVQVIHPPRSKSLNCTCIKSRCRLTENMEKAVCLKEKKSTANKCLTCKISKQKPVQDKCSNVLKQVTNKLENISEQRCNQKTVEYLQCPAPPYNSLESNCKCSKCVFSKHPIEDNKFPYHSSKCLNLPYNSVQKIFEKNLPCSCSSSSTNQKEENSDLNLSHISEEISPDVTKYKQNKETPKSTSEISKNNTQENYKLPENIMFTSDFDSKNIFPTRTTTYQMEADNILSDEIQDEDLLSTFSITTRPKLRVLDIPKYIYKSYSSVFNSQFVLDSINSKEIFFHNSLDSSNDKNSVEKNESSEEYALANISNADKDLSVETNESTLSSCTIQNKQKTAKKIMNIHKLDGKYSVFSMERNKSTGDSETTVYILPNALFSSILSVPAPYFLRERTENEIDDIIQFSHLRKIHYVRNPEFDQSTNATSFSNHNSEEFTNSIANQNIPTMNCAITCSCSSSAPKNQEQQTDEKINYIKVDKTTSITSLQDNENIYTSPNCNSVGIQSSYDLFYSRPQSEEKTSFSSSNLKRSFKKKKYLNDTVKLLENTSHKLEPNMQIMGKYITWKDLISPNLYKPISVQNAITSVKPFIDHVDEKVDMSIQTSNTSNIIPTPEPSVVPPLTIEASTSTGNLETDMSIYSSSRYHLSENLSTIDLPLQYPTTSDSSLSVTSKNLRKYLFQTPSVKQILKRKNSPILTLEASTSTSENKIIVQKEETFTSELLNDSICWPSDNNLIEEETTEMSKYETFVKTSTSKLPTIRTTSSVSLTRLTSLYKYTSLRTQSLMKIEEASTSKVQTNIGVSSRTSTTINSPFMNSILEAIPQLEELSLPNLESVENHSEIPLPKDQISCVSLPKVESLYSISEANYDLTDTEINYNNNDLKYSEETEKLQHSKKFSAHSEENVSFSANSKHEDISIPKKKSSTLLVSELVKENNEELENKTISTSKNGSEDMVDTKLFPISSMTKWNTPSKSLNYSESSIFTSKTSNVYSGSSKPNEDHHNKFDKYHNLGFETNSKLSNNPLDANTEDLQRDGGNVTDEHIHKNLQLENLLSRAIEAYSAYLTLKKGISSNFNVSKIELPYQQSSRNLATDTDAEDNRKDFLPIDSPIQHSSKDYNTDSLTSTSEDYYTAYLKRKERISSLISLAKMDSSYSYLNHIKENDINSPKLSNTNNDRQSSRDLKTDESLSQTEYAHLKLLQRKEGLSPRMSASNIYPPSEHIPKDLQTGKTPSKNSLNQRPHSAELPSLVKNNLSSRNTSLKPNSYRDLTSDKFNFKKDDESSLPFKGKEQISISNKDSYNSLEKTGKDMYNIESEYSKSLKIKEGLYPKDFKSPSGKLKIEEKDSIYRFTASRINNYKDTNNKFNFKNEGDPSITIKNENGTSLNRPNSPYPFSNSDRSNTSSDLKSDKFFFNTRDSYSVYLEGKEEISARKAATPYQQPITKNRSSRDFQPNSYSMYHKNEEAISPRRCTSPPALYPISENENSRDFQSNKLIHNPENRESVSSSRNLETERSLLNYNSASNKNSATSKLSAFVRSGETSALLSNIGDSPSQLSAESIDHILPDVSSSHRVLEAVQSCEQRLQPIKSALKDIKMKLRELHMPEVNEIIDNDQLIDESNKTCIYLPPPPPPLISSRCSYRTKMTFQLNKPIKPLNVTANVNPFSIKHKYFLNDADNSILNANYSSVSDPPYYKQRTSMNSINPSFNQPSRSENKPLHPQRYHPDTYVERPYRTRKPVEVIEEDLPFSPDLKSRIAMDEFQQFQYLPDNHNMLHYQPRTESLNNYVAFPSNVKNSRVYVPVTNSLYKTEHFNNNNIRNMKMFTGDYPVRKNKPKK